MRRIGKIVTLGLGLLTVDSWRMAKFDQKDSENIANITKINTNLLLEKVERQIVDDNLKAKYNAIVLRLKEQTEQYNQSKEKEKLLVEAINKEGGGGKNKEMLFTDLTHKRQNSSYLLDKINKEKADLDNELSKYIDTIDKINENSNTNLGISDIIESFLEWYKNFLSTLSLEQLACLSNIFGYFLIFIAINSMVFIYYGNKIIDYFELESKYPHLAKIINLRLNILDKYLKYQILYIYAISIIFILLNIYMLLY